MAHYLSSRGPTSWQRPDWPCALNTISPFARGIVFASLSTPAVADVVKSRGAASAISAIGNPLIGLSSETWSLTDAQTKDLAFTSAFTVAAWVIVGATAVNTFSAIAGKAAYVSESNNQGWILGFTSANLLRFDSFNNNNSANYRQTTTSPGAGVHLIAIRSDGSLRTIWKDGVSAASTATSPLPASSTGAFNNSTESMSADRRFYVSALMAWNRPLGNDEMVQLYQPQWRWDLFNTPTRRLYVDMAAVVGGTTWPGYQSPFGWH